MRRLSGRINQRTSLYLQSFVALRNLCSGGGRRGENAPCVTQKKSASLCCSENQTQYAILFGDIFTKWTSFPVLLKWPNIQPIWESVSYLVCSRQSFDIWLHIVVTLTFSRYKYSIIIRFLCPVVNNKIDTRINYFGKPFVLGRINYLSLSICQNYTRKL